MKKPDPALNHAELDARREFLKRAGKAATVAPAVSLLLAASGKKEAVAQYAQSFLPTTSSNVDLKTTPNKTKITKKSGKNKKG